LEEENIQMDNFGEKNKIQESNAGQVLLQQPSNKISKPLIAGILLMIAGVLALISWISVITMDVSMIDMSVLQELNPTITLEQIQEILVICGTIGCILAIISILGGILALKRKLWGIALAGGIVGLFTIGPIFASSILALIGLILVATSKKEFQ